MTLAKKDDSKVKESQVVVRSVADNGDVVPVLQNDFIIDEKKIDHKNVNKEVLKQELSGPPKSQNQRKSVRKWKNSRLKKADRTSASTTKRTSTGKHGDAERCSGFRRT